MHGDIMGRITITLNDELDKKLRQTVSDTIGFKKGNLQIAIEEALEEWIREHKKK
jgi:predicted SpoU family rRNA methylase